MRTLLMVFSLCLCAHSWSQDSSRVEVVQFSGLVVTGDSLMPVPFTAVYRKAVRRGTSSDYQGFFSMPAMAGDTIVFSNIGFQTETYVLPDSIGESSVSIVKILKRDTLEIPTTYVYPWPMRDRFRDAFLSLELGDDELALGRKNLASVMMYDRMVEMGADGSENYKIAMQQQADRLYAAGGQIPPMNILNPIAWSQFFQSLKSGAFKRQ